MGVIDKSEPTSSGQKAALDQPPDKLKPSVPPGRIEGLSIPYAARGA